MAKEVDTRYTQDRELSWLRFNERVLEEAKDESVPLMERLKFAAIFTSNLDEFFMIRVGSLYDMTLVKEEHIDSRTGQTPEQQLQAIFKAVTPLYKQRDKVVEQLESRLRACNICRMSMDEMDTKERKQVENWFQDEVRPILSPQVVDSRHPFPHLSNKTLNVVLRLESEGQQFLGLIPVPQSLPPYFTLRERGLRYILTEDVIAEYAKRLFPAFDVKGKAVASVTRNADISPEDETYEVDEDFRQHMRKIVKKRNRLAPVRLELQGGRDDRAIDFLCRQLNLSREQVFFSKSPLRMKYVFSLEGQLPPESKTALCYPPYTPKASNFLRPEEKVLPQVLHHDVLLFYPFQSMDPFLHLVREAPSTAWPPRPSWPSTCAPPPRTARRSPPSWSCGPALTSRTTSSGPSAWRRRAAPSCTGRRTSRSTPRCASSPAGTRARSSISPRWAPATTTKRPPSSTPTCA